jgi:hypothetical protein
VVEIAEELRRVNLRRVWSEYDGFDHRLSNGRYRRISPLAVRPGEGLLSDHIAGAQPWQRERV